MSTNSTAAIVYPQQDDCVFCACLADPEALLAERFLDESDYAVAFLDVAPLSPGHALIVPKRHVADLHDLTVDERNDVFSLALSAQPLLRACGFIVDGYNIAVNAGVAAGQSVAHAHVHLVPRQAGDHEHPDGAPKGALSLLHPQFTGADAAAGDCAAEPNWELTEPERRALAWAAGHKLEPKANPQDEDGWRDLYSGWKKLVRLDDED